MKKIQPINVKRMFTLPLVILFIISVTTGSLLYLFILDRFKTEMTTSGSILVETLSKSLSNNLAHKDDYIESIDSLLVSVGNNIINHRELITNEYLHELTETFVLTDIYWYNSEGLLLNDANNELVGWTPSEGDPIYNFMHSGLDVYVEEIRRGTEDDRHYKFIYIRAEDDFFIQVGCLADVIYDLTQQYEYQNAINQFIENNPELLYALIVDLNFIAIADTDTDEVGVDYSGDEDYEKVLLGETLAADWFSDKIGEDVLEISTPIYYNGDIIGILGIGYSYNSYNQIAVFLIYVFVSLDIFILLSYIIVQYIKIISPLRKFSRSLGNIDLDNIEYRTVYSDYGDLSGLSKLFTNLVNKVYEKNNENFNMIKEITGIAFTDQLTDLPNRRAMELTLNNICIEGNQVAIIYMDIDDFKSVNDNKGHHYGDLLIQTIADMLETIKKDNVYVYRYQGDEFSIVYEYKEIEEVTSLVESIKSIFSQKVIVDDSTVFVEFSIGISLYPLHGLTSDDLLRKANLAMYEAKKTDKMSFRYYDSNIEKNIQRKNEVLSALNDAIKNDRFLIVYQPQVNIDTNEIISLEALLRIKDSSISPYEFITIAEQNRLISKIGPIVIKKVIEQQAKWQDEGIKIVPVYVNYSANQLEDQTLNKFIIDILKSNSIQPDMFGIELTESTIIDNRELTVKTLSEMKSLGIKTAIDDFGSGQAGINYLTDFKVDMVKFDKSFSDQFLVSEKIDIYNAIIELTDKFGFISLAEGIERKEQIDLLKNTSCRLVQGYYYYKPSSEEFIASILKKHEIK